MPGWKATEDEVQALGSSHDVVRRSHLKRLSDLTGRNTIVYYSGWLQKGELFDRRSADFILTEADKNGFMATIHELDRGKGLDLVLHTPGGDIAATESIVDYLRSMFGIDIRAVIPQIAMSAGTMISLACKEVVMGKHSSLGPIDPQVHGFPAHGLIEEFRRITDEVKRDQATAFNWTHILQKYTPTLVGECEKALEWSKEFTKEWLASGMFYGQTDAKTKASRVVDELADHSVTKSHARRISARRAAELGIVVTSLEKSDELQEAVLTVHHACIQTLSQTPLVKLIENQNGVAFMSNLEQL